MPAVSGVAARGKDGVVYLALTNVDPNHAVRLSVTLAGGGARGVRGRVLTAAGGVTAHNDFGTPDIVKPAPFDDARIEGGTLTAALPIGGGAGRERLCQDV